MDINLKVENQHIERQDKLKIVSGSQNYVKAIFSFSNDWNGLQKTAVFKNKYESYAIIVENDTCVIPWEVLAEEDIVSVSVFSSGETIITTDTISLKVEKSGATSGDMSTEPSQLAYDQILEKINNINVDESKINEVVANYIETHKDELKGNDGLDGRGITRAMVQSGKLILTYSDNTSQNVGTVKGSDGSTPKKGVDYFTAEDKAELIASLIESIPLAESEEY